MAQTASDVPVDRLIDWGVDTVFGLSNRRTTRRRVGVTSDMSIIAWIILGLIAGWLAGVLVRGAGYGVIGDIILGILGALVGGWITSALLGVDISGFNLETLLIAVFGAIVIILMGRLISGRTAAV